MCTSKAAGSKRENRHKSRALTSGHLIFFRQPCPRPLLGICLYSVMAQSSPLQPRKPPRVPYSCACLWVELLPGPWPTVWFGVLFHYPLLLVPTLPPPSGWVSQCFSCRNLPHAGSFVQQTSQSSSDGGNWQKHGMWRQWWVLLQPLAKELPVHHPAAFSCLPLPFLLGNSLPLLSAWTVSKGKMGPGTPPKDLWPSPPLTQYSWPFFL